MYLRDIIRVIQFKLKAGNKELLKMPHRILLMSVPYQLRQGKAIEKRIVVVGSRNERLCGRIIIIGDVVTWLTLKVRCLVNNGTFKSDTRAQEGCQIMEKPKPRAEMLIVHITISQVIVAVSPRPCPKQCRQRQKTIFCNSTG